MCPLTDKKPENNKENIYIVTYTNQNFDIDNIITGMTC